MFNISAVDFFRVQIPLLTSFEHAAAARNATDNLICRVLLEDGSVGHGEGVPRRLVTGETIESCLNFFRVFEKSQVELGKSGVEQTMVGLRDSLNRLFQTEDSFRHNAARCALELALLDAIGHAKKQSVVDLFRHQRLPCVQQAGPTFSLVLGRGTLKDRVRLEALAREYNVRYIKIKVGFGNEDRTYLQNVREIFGPHCHLRLDANQAWGLDEAVSFMLFAQKHDVRSIEDPIKFQSADQHFKDLQRLKKTTDCELILDETVRSQFEIKPYLDQGIGDVFSLRLSKCGGFFQCMEMAKLIRAANCEVQVGCQVGETAVLSSAGRQLVDLVGNPRYIEGSNEKFKFSPETYLTVENLGYDREMACRPLLGMGLAVQVINSTLEKFCSERLSR